MSKAIGVITSRKTLTHLGMWTGASYLSDSAGPSRRFLYAFLIPDCNLLSFSRYYLWHILLTLKGSARIYYEATALKMDIKQQYFKEYYL